MSPRLRGHRPTGAVVDSSSRKLTPRQAECLALVEKTIADTELPPSTRELQRMMGLTSNGPIRELLFELEQKGYIRKEPMVARGITVLRHVDGTLATETRRTPSAAVLSRKRDPVAWAVHERTRLPYQDCLELLRCGRTIDELIEGAS